MYLAVYLTPSLSYTTVCFSVGSRACWFLDVDDPAPDASHSIPVCQRGDDHPAPGARRPQRPDGVRAVRGILRLLRHSPDGQLPSDQVPLEAVSKPGAGVRLRRPSALPADGATPEESLRNDALL